MMRRGEALNNGSEQVAREVNRAAKHDTDEGGIDLAGGDGNGQGHSNADTPRPATPRQIEFIRVLASQIRGLGVRRLDAVTETLCGKPLTGLSHAEASALIDVLKNVRAGKLDLQAALKGAAE